MAAADPKLPPSPEAALASFRQRRKGERRTVAQLGRTMIALLNPNTLLLWGLRILGRPLGYLLCFYWL